MKRKSIYPEDYVEPNHEVMSVQDKFVTARKEISSRLVERHREVDLSLTAIAAGKNLALISPPGTAKTTMGEIIGEWVNSSFFYYHMTRFTEPNEIFGPVDVQTYAKGGSYQRLVAGYMPDCAVICLDEVFKASSAILNTTLQMLEKKTVKFGTQVIKCPLISCMVYSNEPPDMQELGALWDRFSIRAIVKYVSKNKGRRDLLRLSSEDSAPKPLSHTITPKEINLARKEAHRLPLADNTKIALWNILSDLEKPENGILISDRRICQAIPITKAFAYIHGAKVVLPEHLEVLAHVLWEDPTDQPKKCKQIVDRIANPVNLHLSIVTNILEENLNPADTLSKLIGVAVDLAVLSGVNQAEAFACQEKKDGDLFLEKVEATNPSEKIMNACQYVQGLIGDTYARARGDRRGKKDEGL